MPQILCFADRTSLYNLLQMKPTRYTLLTSCLLVGMRLVSSQAADQTATHTEWKISVSYRYSKFSWWWAHSCPKHV